ncbi:MAG: glycosyltransferase family 39 protein [Thermodesulfovibrionales bacterium]|nr:glycosyltransferase family 39 protein [Thermodesulfovibrionales bacterium]
MLQQIDTALFFFFNHTLQTDVLAPAAVFLTGQNEYLFIVLALALFRQKQWAQTARLIALALLTVAMADASGAVLKELIGRVRPCRALEGVSILVYCGKSYSMPSNHALNSFAVAGVVFFMTRDRLRYAFITLAALVALTRPMVGVHYPSDIIVGAALGLGLAWAVARTYTHVVSLPDERRMPVVLGLILGGLALFRAYYIVFGPLDLSPDEAHYWEWTRRPDLSYYSKGPMVVWFMTLGTALLGNTEIGVRAPAIALSMVTSVLLYILGRDMYDRRTGFFAAVLYQTIPLFSAYGIVLTIDPPFMFFWVLALLQMRRVLRKDTIHNWMLLGMLVGLGMLAKYTMAFFLICTVCWFAFARDKRKYFATPGPYAGVIAALVFFSPVLIWNAMNGWPTLLHTAGHVNVGGGFALTPGRFLDFTGSQFGVVTPVLLVLMVISLIRTRGDSKGKFLLWYSAPILVFFLAKSWQGKVEPNWGMMAYITGLIALSRDWFAGFAMLTRAKRAIVAVGFAMALAVSVIGLYPADMGVPLKLDPTTRFKGWVGAAAEADRAAKELGEPLFIFSNTYQVASQMAFYMEGNPVTYNINVGRRMNQYDLWPGIGDIDGVTGYNGLFVTMSQQKLMRKVSKAFKKCEFRKYDALDDGRRYLRQYDLYLCRGFKGEFKEKEPSEF